MFKHISSSVPKASELLEVPAFPCKDTSRDLMSVFEEAFLNLATENILQIKLKFLLVETKIGNKVAQIHDLHSQFCSQRNCIGENFLQNDSNIVSKHFPVVQKSQLMDLKGHF